MSEPEKKPRAAKQRRRKQLIEGYQVFGVSIKRENFAWLSELAKSLGVNRSHAIDSLIRSARERDLTVQADEI